MSDPTDHPTWRVRPAGEADCRRPCCQPWSRARLVSLLGAAMCAAGVGFTAAASAIYTGRIADGALFWLAVHVGIACVVTYIGATIRDHISDLQGRVLGRLAGVEEAIGDYGDRREVAGHSVATAPNSGRLTPVS